MPLVRYDVGDQAFAVEGPCPCGRTLPSFGDIQGRWRRITTLPPGAWARWVAIVYGFADLPEDLAGALRQYQAHQRADGTWDLRIRAVGDKAQAIGAFVQRQFASAVPGEAPPMRIIATDQFLGKEGKFQDFVSDFMTA